MAENDPTPNDPDPNAPDADAELEPGEIVTDDKGNKSVSLTTMLRYKDKAKELGKRVKELEPIAAGATELGNRLTAAQPMIDALVNSPKLRAEALRISQGTRTTAETAEQPDDADLVAFAEDNGWYLADGTTPDAARAGRVLARLDARHGKQTDERIRPLAGITLNQKAQANMQEALSATDDDGTPLATRESIAEVAKQLPPQLLADPAVVDLVLNSAIGLDKRKRRTPKPTDEPLYLERQGGGGNRREAPLSKMERDHLAASGISEKDYRASASRLEQGAASRRGIELGK